jgi:hypothetical protein
MLVLKRVAITVEEKAASRMILDMRHAQGWYIVLLSRDILKCLTDAYRYIVHINHFLL